MRDFDRTIVSQYSNSTTLTQLIENFNTYIDPDANLEDFYSFIWNVDTAKGYGLDVWGRIVGLKNGRVLTIAAADYFGFKEANEQPFRQAPFFRKGSPVTLNFTLTDEVFRRLIFAKALANICDGSIPAINQLLLNLFPGRGNCYVQDGGEKSDRFFGFKVGEHETDPVYFGFLGGTTAVFGEARFGDYPARPAPVVPFVQPPGFGQAPFGDYRYPGKPPRFFGFVQGSGFGFSQAPFADLLWPQPGLPPGMNLTYVFEFKLEPFEIAIVVNSGVLPRPGGVMAHFEYLS